jgi:hypothetical protein
MLKIKTIIILFIFTLPLSAQSPFPFGTAPMSDLEMTEYEQDKDAVAVYLFDWCSAKLDVSSDFKVNVERHFRIKILKQDGMDYAVYKLVTGNKSSFTNFKASTFNLEDGKIIEYPINKKEIYTERSGSNNQISFAFTNVKVGSVIEGTYNYSVNSYFFLYPWSFQHSIPVAYSEYNVKFPGLFRYKIDGNYNNIKVNFSQSQRDLRIGSIVTKELSYKWNAGNVPAFKPEPYMASENDYVSRVEFELSGIDWPNYGFQEATPTYEKLTTMLLDDENFGGPMRKSGFLKKKVDEITSGLNDPVAKITAIHRYITGNVKWNERMGIFATVTSFKKVLVSQNGSAADINLLFVAMLQQAGITSCPVILSTRSNGSLNRYFAIVTKFDYVIAYAKVDDKEYLMDATDEFRPFNELPPECLNGEGRTVHPRMSKWIPLINNEQIYDQVMIQAELGRNSDLTCNVQRIYASYSAYNIRNMLQITGKEGFIAGLKLSNGNNEYSDIEILNQDSIGKSLYINYKVVIKGAVQATPELFIINPVLFFSRNENPFVSSERKFPVDFPCPMNEIYTLNIKVPDQYEVDELPSEINLKLEKNGAIFNYSPTAASNEISIRYRLNRKETFFPVDNYNGLKEFYTLLIKKQSELIILKRKPSTVAGNL